MRAVERRLLGWTRATRASLYASVLLGVVTVVLVVVQARVIADLVTSWSHGGPDDWRYALLLLGAIVLVRFGLVWAGSVVAHRSAARLKSELRMAVLRQAVRIAPRRPGGHRPADLALLLARGVDGLDAYLARYLPGLVLAVVAPLLVVGVVATDDRVAAGILAGTVLLVPLFMALIGMATREVTHRRLAVLQRLGNHFLDAVAGLPTLRVFGRTSAHAATLRTMADGYRRETMRVLRVAFLSSLVLELVASLAVALVAVAVGLRLVAGDMDLTTGLFVLILAPEVYLPMRRLGADFHASADGLAAAEQLLAVLDEPAAARGDRPAPEAARAVLQLEDVRAQLAPEERPVLEGFDLLVRPGEVVGLVGPSGCGKTTVLNLLLGLVEPVHGRVSVDGVDLSAIDPISWHDQLSWVPQRPHLPPGSVREILGCGRDALGDDELYGALRLVAMHEVVGRLPGGLDAVLSRHGPVLSAGERQRLAVARALVRTKPLVLLDEPTAGLDAETEAVVVSALAGHLAGHTVVLATHRPRLLDLADRTVRLEPLPQPVPT